MRVEGLSWVFDVSGKQTGQVLFRRDNRQVMSRLLKAHARNGGKKTTVHACRLRQSYCSCRRKVEREWAVIGDMTPI